MFINSTVVFVRKGFNRVRIKGENGAQDSGHLRRQSDSIPGAIRRIMGRVLFLGISEVSSTILLVTFSSNKDRPIIL